MALRPTYDPRRRLDTHPMADISINRSTRITEKTSIQFRAEAFNAMNTFWFPTAQFSNNVNSSSFGTIIKNTASGNPPRHIQLGVKFLF